MKSVVQRVDRASIRVGDNLFSEIAEGALIFLGIEQGDEKRDADYLCKKIINLRMFDDPDGKMNRSLLDIQGELLIVSQFTLLGDCGKGRRPSFAGAERPEKAKILYDYFIDQSKTKVKKVTQGVFQAMMLVEIVNNGPVTILLDSRRNI